MSGVNHSKQTDVAKYKKKIYIPNTHFVFRWGYIFALKLQTGGDMWVFPLCHFSLKMSKITQRTSLSICNYQGDRVRGTLTSYAWFKFLIFSNKMHLLSVYWKIWTWWNEKRNQFFFLLPLPFHQALPHLSYLIQARSQNRSALFSDQNWNFCFSLNLLIPTDGSDFRPA